MAERIREKLEKLDKSALVERAASQWARIRSLLTSKGLDPNFFDRYNARVAKLEATIARLQERGHVPADDIPGVEDPAVDLAEQDISEADRVTDPPPPEEAEREELITKLEEQLIQQAAESKQELEQLQALLAEQDEAHESELKSQKQIFSDAVKKMTEALDIRLAENAEQKAELEAELQTAGKLGARLVAENAEQKAELEALRAQVDEAKGDKERAERWFGAESKGQRAQIASLSTELACLYDIGKELEDKDAELKHSKEELKGLCAKLTRLNDDVRRLTSENHDLKETVAEYRGSWSFRGLDARTADSLTAAEGEKARLEAVVADLQDQIARLQADARTQLIPPPVVAIGGSVGSRLTELLTELRGELTQTAQIKERLEADLRESQAQLAALRAGQTAELQVRDVRLEELEKLLIAARQESAEEIARLEKERAAALQSLGAVQTELAGAQSGVYEKAEQIRELEGKLGEIELQVEAVRRDSEVEV
ncbi:MAG: hypothetical protein KBD64_01235, partial [Gammaproteobacteria bacterium]|nr:hypothetical protein [Gammaproteobacteria bacterium]